MHYCLAGGAGFIGSHLATALLSDDHRVTVLDNLSTGSTITSDRRRAATVVLRYTSMT